MENPYYTIIEEKFQLQSNKLAKKYFDVLWNIYQDDISNFKKNTYGFINSFKTNAYTLSLNNELISFTKFEMPSTFFCEILKSTNWDNTTEIANHTFQIIDAEKIFNADENDFGDIYIIEDLTLLSQIHNWFLMEIL
jgi:hypothetical protein